jgi:CBS domain-containing protein
MFAKDVMTSHIISVTPETSMAEVAALLKEKRINGVPVLNGDDKPVGIITITDFLRILHALVGKINLDVEPHRDNLREVFKGKKVEEYMTREPHSVGENTPISAVMSLMFDRDVHTIPVVTKRKVVGIIGKHDIQELFFSSRLRSTAADNNVATNHAAPEREGEDPVSRERTGS